MVPPYADIGGNMDVRDLTAGTELYLPVRVQGALLSLGDTHAAQGDGEVRGAAIESAIDVLCRVEPIREAGLDTPRFTLPAAGRRLPDEKGYEVTTGIGPDPMENARDALARMIDLVAGRHGLTPADVYMLCGCCADPRIGAYAGPADRVVRRCFPRLVPE